MFGQRWSLYRKICYILVLLLLALPAQSFAVMQGDPDHFVGDGSDENPFLITTEEDLILLREVYDDYAGKVFLQVADIDLSGINWMPIGNADKPFEAVYDGGGYRITGLSIDLSDGWEIGLFGVIGYSGIVKNLTLETENVMGSIHVGGLAGENYGLISDVTGTVNLFGGSEVGGLVGVNYGVIRNISVHASVQADSIRVGGLVGSNEGMVLYSHVIGMNSVTCITYGENCDVKSLHDGYVGGLTGYNAGLIRNSSSSASVRGNGSSGGLVGLNNTNSNAMAAIIGSHASGDVYSTEDFSGGLVGFNQAGTILHSGATGNVRTTNDAKYIGGLVGILSGESEIAYSYASGNVEGGRCIGGLVGESNSNSKVRRSYATGKVSGTFYVGGLIGFNSGQVEYSFATGDVQGSDQGVGGLIGSHYGSVRNAYATGNVNGSVAGGFIGSVDGDSVLVEYAYSSGNVFAEEVGGGFIGLIDNSAGGTFTNSYWNMSTSGYEIGVGVNNSDVIVDDDIVGLHDAEMIDPSSFAGWDFDHTWEILEGNLGPTLQTSIDHSRLIEAIDEAEMILAESKIGYLGGEYSRSTIEEFYEHILIAKQMLNNSSSQTEIDQAELDLRMAIDTFISSAHPVKLIFANTLEDDRFVRLYFNAKIEAISSNIGVEGFYISDPDIDIVEYGHNYPEGWIELALSGPLQSTDVEVTVTAGTVYFKGNLVENDSTIRVMTQSEIEQLQMELQLEGNNEQITIENIVRYISTRNVDINGDGISDLFDIINLMRFINPYGVM